MPPRLYDLFTMSSLIDWKEPPKSFANEEAILAKGAIEAVSCTWINEPILTPHPCVPWPSLARETKIKAPLLIWQIQLDKRTSRDTIQQFCWSADNAEHHLFWIVSNSGQKSWKLKAESCYLAFILRLHILCFIIHEISCAQLKQSLPTYLKWHR